MKLADALIINQGDIVAFVGAGGKTTAMFRLANELAERGLRVVTTTTTRMAADERLMAPVALSLEHLATLESSLAETGHVFVFSRLDAERDKVIGIPPERVPDLTQFADVVLIEADGSRRLPLKGPYAHEPVIPTETTLVILVAGLDAVGQPLDPDHVYGAENIHAQMELDSRTIVDGRLLGSILVHPLLGLKGVPAETRIIALLNKLTTDNLSDAGQAAQVVLSAPQFERVLLGAVQATDPITQVQRHIGAVILAAGLSRRMGEPKVLLPWGENSTIIRQIAEVVTGLPLAEIIVVTGRWDDPIRAQLDGLPIAIAENPHYAAGEMISSVKVGLSALDDHIGAALVVLGDQPDLNPDSIVCLMAAYAQTQSPIVAPVYQGKRGHPVLFDRSLWSEIQTLPEGAAPRDILRAHQDEIVHIEVATDTILQDIDTPEDYNRQRPA